MSQHTPGPWGIGKCKDGSAGIWTSKGHIAEVHYNSEDEEGIELPLEDDAEAHANARLIAAAPDLLDACQRVLPKLIEWIEVHGGGDPNDYWEVDLLRKVIAKAEGK